MTRRFDPPVEIQRSVILQTSEEDIIVTIIVLDGFPTQQLCPPLVVAEIVNRLKGASSRLLRSEFPHLKSRLPTLWTKSYYAGTIGSVSEETVRNYIENQKGR